MNPPLNQKACCYLKQLCLDLPERYVGSDGNRRAADLLESYLRSFSFETSRPSFDCLDWKEEGASLWVDEEYFPVRISPYSPGGKVSGPLVTVSSVEELKQVSGKGQVVLLKGEITREQLLPKNFPFLSLPEHREVIDLLENGGFKAVICATSYHPQMAGGRYPFPLIEDGDFILPSVYLTDREGKRLAAHQGKIVSLEVKAIRRPAKGYNVVARKGQPGFPRVVFCAHLDSKQGTPGALDNAAGLVVLLLLAEQLRDYCGAIPVEIVALNGEDYYSNPGEMLYLTEIQSRPEKIMLGVNIDGVGYIKGDTAVSTYGCPSAMEETVSRLITNVPGMVQGAPWYQGDHALFLQNRIPALGITSGCMEDILAIAHTPRDNVDLVDCVKLGAAADFLYHLLHELNQAPNWIGY